MHGEGATAGAGTAGAGSTGGATAGAGAFGATAGAAQPTQIGGGPFSNWLSRLASALGLGNQNSPDSDGTNRRHGGEAGDIY